MRSPGGSVGCADDWESAGVVFSLLLLVGIELGSCRKEAERLEVGCGCEIGAVDSGGTWGMGKTL